MGFKINRISELSFSGEESAAGFCELCNEPSDSLLTENLLTTRVTKLQGFCSMELLA
jgi:hypothetical protein